MTDDQVLRARARQAMKIGRLPEHRPERIWGGPGSGASCAVCGKDIGQEGVEFELQFSPGEQLGSGNYQVHVKCFEAWELERRTGGSNCQVLPGTNDSGIIGCERSAASQGEGR
jgi:hypothetical protein